MSQTLDEAGKIQLASECYIIHKDKVLMFKRSSTASKFPGFWIGPGGHIDDKEDALTSATREVREETGVKITTKEIKLKAIAFHNHIDRQEIWISFIFLANITKHQTEKKVDKEGSSTWIPLNKLLSMKKVFPPTKYYFNHVLKNKQGILYANITWKNAKLVKVHSHQIDTNG